MSDRHPEHYRGRGSVAKLRVSDEARERTVRFLRRAYRRGRISVEELDERSEAAYAATTRGDLYVLVRDLPGHRYLARRARGGRFWRTLARMLGFRRRRR